MPRYTNENHVIFKDGWPLMKIVKHGRADFPTIPAHEFDAEFTAMLTAVNSQPIDRAMFDLLCQNLDAWEDEEDSVREEHEDLISETDAFIKSARLRFANPPSPDHRNDTVDALALAQAQLETFAAFDKGNGGADSDLHTALEAVKSAIVREQARPDVLTVLQMTIPALEWCEKQWAKSPQQGEGINVLSVVRATVADEIA